MQQIKRTQQAQT